MIENAKFPIEEELGKKSKKKTNFDQICVKKCIAVYTLYVWVTPCHQGRHHLKLWTMEEMGTVISWASPIYTFFHLGKALWWQSWIRTRHDGFVGHIGRSGARGHSRPGPIFSIFMEFSMKTGSGQIIGWRPPIPPPPHPYCHLDPPLHRTHFLSLVHMCRYSARHRYSKISARYYFVLESRISG